MGEYKRLISYIYSYEKGVKSKNSGFAKIESRNGLCKVSISARISDVLLNETEDNMLEVFLFCRKEDEIRKIFIGRIKIVSGCSNFKTQINFDNESLSDINFSDIAGIFICSKTFLHKKNNINIIYASEWDDIPIVVYDFVDKQEAIVEDKTDEKLENSDESDYSAESENSDNPQSLENELKSDSDNIELVSEKEIEDSDEINNQEEDETQIVTDEVVYTVEKETETKEECVKELKEILVAAENKINSENFFEELSSCYSKIKVEEIEGECIKIAPKDISYLPKKYWHLSNNSFLLHGFYNYKYILLCENIVDNKKVYKICVPGVFHNKEQTMARMFGFTEFKCKGQREMMRFGYWCINL